MADNRRVLRPGQIYRHFKGKLYQIITVAVHSETGEELVIYQKLYEDFRVHARPLDMFLSEVDRRKYPRARQRYRFELLYEPEFLEKQDSFSKKETGMEAGLMDDKKIVQTDDSRLSAGNPVTVAEKEQKYAEPQGIWESDTNINENEQQGANPCLLQFLDADTFEEKKNVLVSIKNRMTDRLIDDIAAALDVTVDEGELETRYNSLMNCVETRRKFECNRFR
ncbi:MAG: DUF1653 domain-containing protein [Lachnospiraceae bacterium]|nr:DUF1653 domain-containing protein [Lachnospiraceae bacterium]